MKKAASSRKIKNSTLVALFFIVVFFAIIISLIIKIVSLVRESTFDNHHQFVLEVKQPDQEERIVIFHPGANEVAVLHLKKVRSPREVQTLQIPIDAQFTMTDTNKEQTLPSLLFTMIFHCSYPACQNLNTVDAIKAYMFAKNLRPTAIQTTEIAMPVSPANLKTTIPALFTDETLYHEALSISVINASGEAGLGNELSQLLTNIGGNVVSVSSGDMQETTTMQSVYEEDTYSIQRLQKVLHLKAQKMQKSGISDIIITIGKKHPPL